MKVKNLVIYNRRQEVLRRLFDEYRNYCGYKCKLENGKLTIFAQLDSRHRIERAKEEPNTTWENTTRSPQRK